MLNSAHRQSEEEVEELLKKHMLESDDQLKIGLKNKAFKRKDCIRVDQTMHRICAPTDTSRMKSFILWTKRSPNDTKPTWEKVVCSLNSNIVDLLLSDVGTVWGCCPQSG
jgi:hypothetical protein